MLYVELGVIIILAFVICLLVRWALKSPWVDKFFNSADPTVLEDEAHRIEQLAINEKQRKLEEAEKAKEVSQRLSDFINRGRS